MSSTVKISPSILSADFGKLGAEISELEKAGADLIHIDVMDGHFVQNITIGPEVIKNLKNYTSLPFDVHLMISPVHKYIKNFAEAGANIITIHPEATNDLIKSINEIKKFNKKVGISLNPETKIDKVLPVINLIDLVLIMSVNPGFGGQKFIKDTLKKVKLLRKEIDTGPIIARKRYPPPPGVDPDYVYDSVIRSDLLIFVLQEYSQHNKFINLLNQPLVGNNYYVIHPVLKHIALLKNESMHS